MRLKLWLRTRRFLSYKFEMGFVESGTIIASLHCLAITARPVHVYTIGALNLIDTDQIMLSRLFK